MAGGWHDFVVNEKLTSANVQQYLMDQAVQQFADATARDAAVSGGNLVEGMVAYLRDVNTIVIYDGSAWKELVDLDLGTGAWPSWTIAGNGASSGSINFGTGATVDGRYHKVGRRVHAKARIIMGTSPSWAVSGAYQFTLPVSAANSLGVEDCGGFAFYDASAGAGSRFYHGDCMIVSATKFQLTMDTLYLQGVDYWESGKPFTVAQSDQLLVELTYESAA